MQQQTQLALSATTIWGSFAVAPAILSPAITVACSCNSASPCKDNFQRCPSTKKLRRGPCWNRKPLKLFFLLLSLGAGTQAPATPLPRPADQRKGRDRPAAESRESREKRGAGAREAEALRCLGPGPDAGPGEPEPSTAPPTKDRNRIITIRRLIVVIRRRRRRGGERDAKKHALHIHLTVGVIGWGKLSAPSCQGGSQNACRSH